MVPKKRKRQPRVPQPHWLVDYIKENPIKVTWISLLAFGALSLLSYFFHIEYFPNFDFQSATNVFLALTYVTAFVSLAFSALFLLPSIGAAALLNSSAYTSTRSLLRFIATTTAWSFLSFLILGIILTLKSDSAWPEVLYVMSSLLLTIVVEKRRQNKRRKKNSGRAMPQRAKKIYRERLLRNVLSQFFCTALQFFPLLAFFLIVSKGSDLTDDNELEVIRILSITSLLFSFAGALFLLGLLRRPNRKLWLISVLVLLLLPQALGFFARATGLFPMMVAELTKVGNFRAKHVSISSKSCSNIKSALGITCDSQQTDPIQLCNVHIMSRIGTEVYLRASVDTVSNDDKRTVTQLFIPASQIDITEVDFSKKLLSLRRIDEELIKKSSACPLQLEMRLSEALFTFDGFTLSEDGKSHLGSFIQAIKRAPDSVKELKVVGYTDLIGEPAHNRWLARQRALQVSVYLRRELENLPKKINIREEAGAEADPVVQTCGTGRKRKECEAPNRRVEISVIPA